MFISDNNIRVEDARGAWTQHTYRAAAALADQNIEVFSSVYPDVLDYNSSQDNTGNVSEGDEFEQKTGLYQCQSYNIITQASIFSEILSSSVQQQVWMCFVCANNCCVLSSLYDYEQFVIR